MALKRRDFLIFLGASTGSIALGYASRSSGKKPSMPFTSQALDAKATGGALSFKPVKGPLPLPTDNLELVKQVQDYNQYEVKDDLVLPENFTYDVIAAWGDKVGDSRFGYNNDYLSFIEVGKDGINVFALKDDNSTKAAIREIAKEALIDLGIGVISLRREANGQWVRTNSKADRRITGISGLEDGRYLKATGPAVAVFRKKGKGYDDKLGDQIIGTFNNCAGGTTPWGTVFSAEENIQNFVPEVVYPDGTSFDPAKKAFYKDDEEIGGLGNVFGLAGNKYGWMVEVDPSNPNDCGTKHTWLGRYRHEAVGIRVEVGKQLAFYSGCDRRSGHIYKFVSKGTVSNPKDKANSRLLEDGMLYAAKFNPDGTGRWIALKADTPV